MEFGEALRALREGRAVGRAGWNGKGMFLYLVQQNSYPALTDVAKKHFGNNDVPYRPYIAMKTVDNNVVPWVASQSDLLMDDWEVVEV